MTSHFDAHRLGEPPPQPRKCRVETAAEAEALHSLIGEDNVAACKRALEDGAQVWVFQNAPEITNCAELVPAEKQECRRILREMNNRYVGWFRSPKRVRSRELLGVVADGS